MEAISLASLNLNVGLKSGILKAGFILFYFYFYFLALLQVALYVDCHLGH